MDPKKRARPTASAGDSKRPKDKGKDTNETVMPIHLTDVVIHLDVTTLKRTSLKDPRIITILSLLYITEENASTSDGSVHYLCDIIAHLFETDRTEVKLYRQQDGLFRPEKDPGWQPVGQTAIVRPGVYLTKVARGVSPKGLRVTLGNVNLDPIKVPMGEVTSRLDNFENL
jgi:hypothetical protein